MRRRHTFTLTAFVLMTTTAMLGASGLACTGTPAAESYYRLIQSRREAPFWECTTSTPIPTDPPPPEPPWWPTGVPWDPEPPTPYPTPTPYIMQGSFYLRQAIWIPYDRRPMPGKAEKETAPKGGRYLRLRLTSVQMVGDPPGCLAFEVEIRNYSDVEIDFNAYEQIFIQKDDHIKFADLGTLQDLGLVDIESRPDTWTSVLEPGQEAIRFIPACGMGGDKLRVGVITSPNESGTSTYDRRKGTAIFAGSDTVIYINPWELAPNCFWPPHPEVNYFPGYPPVGYSAYSNYASGGRLSAGAPVSIPPCLYVTRGFGCVETPALYSSSCPADAPWFHAGIDVSCYGGEAIVSAMDGAVAYKGWSADGYGNLVVVGHGPYAMYYAHMSGFAPRESPCSAGGGNCARGQVVGYIGSTGNSTGNHLHWELRVNGLQVDPSLYVGGHGKAGGVTKARQEPEAPEPRIFPMNLILRTQEGKAVQDAGIKVHLKNVEGEPVHTCTFPAGVCSVGLPMGVYTLDFEGVLGGRLVNPHGQAHEDVMNSGRAEILYGPMAVWHEGPEDTIGLVLMEEAGQPLQPYFDRSPESTPEPLIPKVPDPGPPVPLQAGPTASETSARGLHPVFIMGLCLLSLCLLTGSVLIGRRLWGGKNR